MQSSPIQASTAVSSGMAITAIHVLCALASVGANIIQQSVQDGTPVPLVAVVIAWNRPASLARLIRSLEAADYGAAAAPIEIRFALDASGNQTVDDEIDQIIRSIRWPFGLVRVRRRLVHVGLKENVLGAWTPSDEEAPAPAVFLEDDVELSRLWWHWVQACLRTYATHGTWQRQLIGVSLFTPDNLNEPYENGGSSDPNGKFVPSCEWQGLHWKGNSRKGTSAVLFGQPCSWGAVYFPWHWAAFRQFVGKLRHLPPEKLPKIPCPPDTPRCKVSANHWGRNSWKRLMIYYMTMSGLYMVYPNFPGRAGFSTNHVEPGVHLSQDPQVLYGQRARHRMKLIDLDMCRTWRIRCSINETAGADNDLPPFSLPSADSIQLYDFYCRIQPPAAEGALALREAGRALEAKLPSEMVGGAPVVDDPSNDGSEYLIIPAVGA